MPPKGFVGIKLTPQRKLTLSELMEQEGFAKPSEAIDYALALGQDFVKTDPDAIAQTELPNFVNYYVGDTSAVVENGTVAPLVEAERRNTMVSNLTWRLDALAFIRNYEPTIVNMADAIDFALTACILHSRAGTVSAERKEQVKNEVRRNAVAFREEVREYLQDHMQEVEAEARKAGTKLLNQTVKSKGSIGRQYEVSRQSVNALLTSLYRSHYNKAKAGEDTTAIDAEIEAREKQLQDLDRSERQAQMADASEKAKRRSPAIRRNADGEVTEVVEDTTDALPF